MTELNQKVFSQQSSQYNPSKQLNRQGNDRFVSIVQQNSFEKNYPKNIFIPIIEYLNQIGLKQTYQRQIGTRQQFEGKNVVSLGMIHHLISQQWFANNVDKNILLKNLSNKVLMNSKIKKKLFHLYVAKIILQLPEMACNEFKKKVSKQANHIGTQSHINDELFLYSNSIIYLLKLMLKTLKKYSSIKQNQTDDQLNQSCNSGSKQVYKVFSQQIIAFFNQKNKFNFCQLYSQLTSTILQRQSEILSKFKFQQGILNWELFITYVIDRCFQFKQSQRKLTNTCFNDWVKQFKDKVTTVEYQPIKEEQPTQWSGVRTFHPIIILYPNASPL